MSKSNLIAYVESLGRRYYEEIGFIPIGSLEKAERDGHLYAEYENGDMCGYLYFGGKYPQLKIYQACIQYDSRRREHGMNLIKKLIRYADMGGYESIALWCAADIEANLFWKAMGFVLSGSREGGKRRGRKHNLWMFWLPQPKQILLFPPKEMLSYE